MRIIVVIFVFVSFLTISCSSQIGGTLIGFNKEAVPDTLVRLIVIDDEGQELEEVGFTVTSSNGNFDFGFADSLGSSFVIEGVLPEGRIRAFAMGNGKKTDVSPVTDAIVSAVIYVTETDGGRSLSDFERSELRDIIKDVLDDAAHWEVSYTHTQELINTVIESAGRAIPEAAGGSLSAVNSASLDAPNVVSEEDPAFDVSLLTTCVRNHYVLEGKFFYFDINEDGALCKIASQNAFIGNAYAIAYQLKISGDTFKDPGTGVDTGSGAFPGDGCGGGASCPDTSVEDENEVVFGPVETLGGLKVTRKVYVNEQADYVRYLEIVENPTESDKTISLAIDGDLGIGDPPGGNVFISTLLDSSGDLIIDENDDYAASITQISNNPVPVVGYIWDGAVGFDRVDTVNLPPSNDVMMYYEWQDVALPAGSTKVYMHYAFITSTKDASQFDQTLESIYLSPDETGMNSTELNGLQNFAVLRGNIRGEAGSLVSSSSITITNVTRVSTMSVNAQRDGSFAYSLNAQSGDEIKVETPLSSFTLNVP